METKNQLFFIKSFAGKIGVRIIKL